MEELGNKYKTDKVTHHGYQRFYDFFLKDLRNKSIKMLEIGIHRQCSLNMWLEYFKDSFVYGIDIGVEEKGDRYHIIKGDQSSLQVLKQINEKLDFIIDDGSHLPEHQIISFNYLFENTLNDGGTYIIEDIETSYWKKGHLYGNYLSHGYMNDKSVVEIFKKIVDDVNSEFLSDNDKNIKEKYENPVPLSIRDKIGMITFCQNCIIIKKKDKSYDKYNNRKYRFSNNTQ